MYITSRIRDHHQHHRRFAQIASNMHILAIKKKEISTMARTAQPAAFPLSGQFTYTYT